MPAVDLMPAVAPRWRGEPPHAPVAAMGGSACASRGARLSGCDDAEVIVAGGVVRKRDRGIVGQATIDFIRQVKVDISIIGVSGIEADGTLLDYAYREVRVTQAIMEQSRQVWLVADHTKFGRPALVRLGAIGQVDKFFTDRPLPVEAAEAFDQAAVEVIVAAPA